MRDIGDQREGKEGRGEKRKREIEGREERRKTVKKEEKGRQWGGWLIGTQA